MRSPGPAGAVLASLLLLAAIGCGSTPARSWHSAPVVPSLEGKTRSATLATVRLGRRLGNRPDVFAKVGDSISESPAFLGGLGCLKWQLGLHPGLQSTIAYFARRPLGGLGFDNGALSNSFNRPSAATRVATLSGWPRTPGAARGPRRR